MTAPKSRINPWTAAEQAWILRGVKDPKFRGHIESMRAVAVRMEKMSREQVEFLREQLAEAEATAEVAEQKLRFATIALDGGRPA